MNTKPYRVEVHKKNFAYVAHFFLDTVVLLDDYLSPDENTVEVPLTSEIDKGQWIHIARDSFSYFGIITSVRHDMVYTTIGFKPFNSIFAYPVLFDTQTQVVTQTKTQPTLEQVIANLINEYWVTVSDTTQRLSNLEVSTISSTSTKWTFYIEPDSDITDYAIVNFFDDIIRPAMEQYYIAVNAVPNFSRKIISVTVGKVGNLGSKPYAFEADLDNVISRNVGVYTSNVALNKLIVYNADNYNTSVVFYKHPDGSVTYEDTDRMYPVNYDIETAQATEYLTFADAALDRAISRFLSESDSNLIELTYLQNDSITANFAPIYGRTVVVHYRDKQYTTVLTGLETDENTVKYIFGVVRVDLTKTIKRRKYNGK